MSLIDYIEAAMLDDDADREEQSDYLRRAYMETDTAGREAIDSAFIALCGYSLQTLLNRHDRA